MNISGTVILGILFASISDFYLTINAEKSAFQRKIHEIRIHMKEIKISPQLKHQVLEYYYYY